MSRQKIEITEDIIVKIRQYAALGLTNKQIADAMGFSEATFYNKKAENLEFLEAVNKGKADGIAAMAARLLEQAKNGSTAATIFYLKCHGWKEANALEVTTNRGGSGMADFYKEFNRRVKEAGEQE